MRRLYLVAYDIRHPKRLRRVERKLRGYGVRLQYSVFQCELTAVDRARLPADLELLIRQGEDRVLIIDLGPAKRQHRAWEALGMPAKPLQRQPVII